jgi:hypothetical protein
MKAMLPPPYQRPPGAECPATGFSVVHWVFREILAAIRKDGAEEKVCTG